MWRNPTKASEHCLREALRSPQEHTGRPHRETTQGDHAGRPLQEDHAEGSHRETTAGGSHRETTVGRPHREITAEATST